MKKLMLVAVFLVLALSIGAVSAFSQGYTKEEKIDLRARIPQQNGFDVAINRIQGSTWSSRSTVDFGDLYFDNTNNIFLSNYIYAVDLGVTANLLNWSLKHTRTSLANASVGANLDNNINVSFVKQLSSIVDEPLEKVTYQNSDNKIFTKGQLADGWLRIYYGIATGEASNDAPGALPITAAKPAATYTGKVTLTLFETL
jgi:hypothetical protein